MIYTAQFRNSLQRDGFVMVPNLLIEFQEELGITDPELLFLIRVMKHKDGFVLHDSQLSSETSRSLSKKRASLKAKGLINFVIVKKSDVNTGLFSTEGISYDLTPLERKLQLISDSINEDKVKQIPDDLEGFTSEELEPLNEYKEDYKEHYKTNYNPTKNEIKCYAKLSLEDKKLISFIFEFCKERNLLGKVVPRLSFFFKTHELVNLKNWCAEKGYIETEEMKKEREEDEERERKRLEELELTNKISKELYDELVPKEIETFSGKDFLYSHIFQSVNVFYPNMNIVRNRIIDFLEKEKQAYLERK